jgi:hypothetical protein
MVFGVRLVERLYQFYSGASFTLCHPEAHLLREGSPGMFQFEMHVFGSSARRSELIGRRAKLIAMKSEISPEILRAKEALQDDRS